MSEITEVVGDWKALGPRVAATRCCGALAPGRGRLRAVDVRGRPTTARASSSVTPRYADVPARGAEAHRSPTSPSGRTRSNQLVPLTEVVHDRLNVEVFRGCTRGCRFCQAGMITRPVRERPAEQVRTMVAEGLQAHRLRRGGPHLAVDGRLQRHRVDVVDGIVDDPANCGQVSVSLPSLRVDAFTVGIAAQIQKARRTGPHVRPRGRHLAHAPGHQQADPRGGPLRRRRVRLLAGLAADEAVLPHRSPHRDRRGHARHRRAGPQRRRDRAAPPQEPVGDRVGRRVRARSRSRRSSGSARTPRAELQRKVNLLRDATRRERGVDLKWHDPKAARGRRASPAAAIAASAR